MDWLLYIVAKSLIIFIQMLPLRLVARLGRVGGRIVCLLDARHRRVARRNIARCFPEKSSAEVRALVKENFRRIGEGYACGIKTIAMSAEELRPILTFAVPAELTNPSPDQPLQSVVMAMGHFGSFEAYAHLDQCVSGYRRVVTYRALRQPLLNQLVQTQREKSGILFFERRFDVAKLRAAMHQPGMMLGLSADQDGGDRGLQLPFLGHNCSTTTAPAVFALRYHCRLYPAFCYRTAPARWHIEIGEEIPTRHQGALRSTEAIMREVNTAFEAAVRRDPANWFWVHNRWKRGRPDEAAATSTP